jgi:4-aminobutyrate aminotransferase-like enzyme
MRKSKILAALQKFESRNITFIEKDGSWPIVWKKAKGTHVWDEQNRKYLDLTAAFGVAAAGHSNARVVRAGQKQMAELLHAMGDVHPHARKAELARELSRITFERWNSGTGKTIFTNSGFEAVEAALKTACLLRGRHRIIAFEGAYHGLGYGALNVTHRNYFRGPFREQITGFADFIEFPCTEEALRKLASTFRPPADCAAILVEPIQGRAGMRVPPPGFLPLLRKLCDERNLLLILDEIHTGFGRTGFWFACERNRVVPDLICVGKALTGGFPLSACVGKASVMDAAWPASTGEAIHTSTFLGHPVGCAMALANIKEIQSLRLPQAAAEKGEYLLELLAKIQSQKYRLTPRGLGLMAGLEMRTATGEPATNASLQLVKNLLRRGFIFLPGGEHSNVISFTPPLTISLSELRACVRALTEELKRV